MPDIIRKVVKTARQQGFLSEISDTAEIPIPGTNKVELYLSFHGNDCCSHCITCSGPHRKETMDPESARLVIDTIARHSVITRLNRYLGNGRPVFYQAKSVKKLDGMENPPDGLSDSLLTEYADALMGKGATGMWMKSGKRSPLNFGRPSVRISGGEFFTWPHTINGSLLSEAERLQHQCKFLEYMRERLPEYDIWILTNGRFAENGAKAERVVTAWAPQTPSKTERPRGTTRVCVSVDPFHALPKNTHRGEMLARLWKATKKAGMSAPYIYGIPNKRIFLLGRALKNHLRRDSDCFDGYEVDPISLRETDGCNELKGLFLKTAGGVMLVNNIVVNYNGHLSYCCAGVGDYGDFITSPENTLLNLVKDPVARMLRGGESAEKFLRLAAELDPTITVFDTAGGPATGSTCYQLLSGWRCDENSDQPLNETFN